MPTEVASTTATATNTATTATKTTSEESRKENGVNSNQLRQPPTSGSKPESTRNASTSATSTVALVTKTDATTQTTTVAPAPAPLPTPPPHPPQLQAHPAAHHHPPPHHHVITPHHFMSPYGVLPVAHFDPNAYTNAIRGTPLPSSVPNTVITHKAAVAISSRTAAPARSVVVSAAVPTSAPAPAAFATATTASVAAATNTTTNTNAKNNNKSGSDVSTADVLQVGPCDVLCGRGGATNNHNGNRRFRRIVAEHQKEYLSARKRDKRVIATVIVARVRKEGGRFLKREVSGRWTEVDDRKACEKTSQALREGLDVRRKVAAGETSPTTTMSDTAAGETSPTTTMSETATGTTPPAAKRARTDDVVPSVIPAPGTDDSAAENKEPSKTVDTGDAATTIKVGNDATKTKGNDKAVNGSNPPGSVVPI